MITLRCTQRVLKRLGAVPSSAAVTATTRLGDWYAAWVPLRRPLVMFMNEQSLLVVLVHAAPIRSLLDRWLEATHEFLVALEVPESEVVREIDTMKSPVVGATANRRILGCLNEATQMLKWLHARHDAPGLRDAEIYLADTMYSTIKYQHPRDLALEAFGLPCRSRSSSLH
jgi:hypothetical protein